MYLGNGIGIIAEDPQSASTCPQLFSTVDSVYWHNISPPQPSSAAEPCPYFWQSASFISPTQGWVLGRDGGNTTTVLFSTDNGGTSWTREIGSSTGSNGGVQVIGFTSEGDGWRQQFATGSNAPYLLETTADGGETWNELPQQSGSGGCPFAMDVFADPMDGFAGNDFTPGAMGAPPPQAFIWQTTDGGRSWRQAVVPRPPAFVDADAFYGLPTFFNPTNGVLPVDYELDGVATMAFYATADAGMAWTLESTVKTTSTADTSPRATACSPSETQGDLPAVGVADAPTWWVLGAGGTDVEVTSNSGLSWTDVNPAGIGSAETAGADLSFVGAIGSTVAWITFSDEATGSRSFQTTDGGRTWFPIDIPPSAPPPAPSCGNDQLAIALGGAGGGLGHEGQALLITNVSSATCTLFGYPGVAGLDDAGQQVIQAVRTLSGYLGGLWNSPEGPPPTVTLAPQQTASALVEWTDVNMGSTPCVQLHGLLVTAPNTTRSVDLPVAASPCSGMEVHPVVPGTSGTVGD